MDDLLTLPKRERRPCRSLSERRSTRTLRSRKRSHTGDEESLSIFSRNGSRWTVADGVTIPRSRAGGCLELVPTMSARSLRALKRKKAQPEDPVPYKLSCDILSIVEGSDCSKAGLIGIEDRPSSDSADESPSRKRPFTLSLGPPSVLRGAGGSPNSGVGTPPLSPTMVVPWTQTFCAWSEQQKKFALNELLGTLNSKEIRYLHGMIEPQFKRDFLTHLPSEMSLKILSYLSPLDLMRCSEVCSHWKGLCNDQLLWRKKCLEHGISDTSAVKKRRKAAIPFRSNPWKAAYCIKYRIEFNWRTAELRPRKVLKGHDDHVITCLQYSGNRIISGSDDNTLKVWSVTSGKCLRTLHGHTGGVWCSQFINNTVISGSTDRTLKIWNSETGICLHTLVGHTSTVRCLAVADTRVVSGSRDASLRVWQIQTGELLHVLMGHVAAVRCVQFDGQYVVSGSYDCTVRVWMADSGECLHVLQGHNNRVYSLQFDGTHIVSGSLDTSIRVWDVVSGSCLHTLWGHQSLTSGMELSGDILVSGNADSTVKVWNIVTGQCLHTFHGQKGHQSAVTSLQFNEKFAVTSSDDGTVKLWDMKTGEFIRDLVSLWSSRSGGVVWRVCCSEQKLVCAVGSRNGTEDTKLLVMDFDHM